MLAARALSSPWTLFLVAFVLRLIVAGQLISTEARSFYAENEQARIAWAVVSGYGYSSPWPQTPLQPTAQQPPVYPYLLAGIFRVAGAYSIRSLHFAVALNAAFSALTAVLIYRIGKRRFDDLVAVAAAWLWACWIYEIVVSARLWESSLSALLLSLGLWLLGKLTRTRDFLPWLGFGALAGLSALTNTSLLAVFACFWIWLWMACGRRTGALRLRWLASVAVCIVVLVPWTVRNYATFHRLLPVRDNLGMELWVGNHEGVTHLYDFRGGFPLLDPTEYNRLGEVPFMEAKRHAALAFIRQHPRDFLQLCGQRLVDFWTIPTANGWWALSLTAWLGLALAVSRKRFEALPEAAVMIVFPVIYYITHTWSTYRHPIEPVMILLAAYAAVETAKSLRILRAFVRGKTAQRS
jgi:Dolichyl-phosphate-mannose-protein mannosyltransferase